MGLKEELQRQLLAFVHDRLTERELFMWLGGVGREIDGEDAETRELWVAASGLLSEVAGYPHDVRDVRADMAELLGPQESVRLLTLRAATAGSGPQNRLIRLEAELVTVGLQPQSGYIRLDRGLVSA